MRRTGLAGLLVFLLTAAPAHGVGFNEAVSPLSPIALNGIAAAIEHGDFDRDGVEDLAVGDNRHNEIEILRGTGGGAFTSAGTVPIVLPTGIEAGHFDADGDLDLAVVDVVGDRLTILRGAAGATFTNAGSFTTADGPVQVDAADLNGDLDLDLVVTEQGAQGSDTVVETVAVYLGGAGITFSGPRRYTAGQAPRDTVVVDLTGDRRPEIVVANREERNLAVFRNIGDGTFTSRTTVSLPANPECVDAGHLDGDGRPDLAVCLGEANAVRLLAGTGGTGFQEVGNLSAGAFPDGAEFRDFDADDDDDLVVTNLFSDDMSVYERTDQAITAVRRIPVGQPHTATSHDLDGDGATDVAITNAAAGQVRLMLSTAMPPQTTITTKPPAASSNNTPTFAFTSSERYSSFQCRVVGRGDFASCPSPFTLSALPDGDHEFQVRAVDASSAADPTAAIATFRVDTTPPDATISGGPTGATHDTTPSFTVGASEPATITCRLNGGPVNPCSGAVTLGPLADGAYTFEVAATDAVGNSDPTPARRTFSVDTVPPAAPTLSEHPGAISQPAGRFAFSSAGAARFECRLGEAAFGACPSPYEFSGLSEGEWTFAVRAVDEAGNVGAPSAHTWTVDGTPPETAIDAGPAVLSSVNGGQITFSTTGGASFECRLEPADFAPCTSPYEFTGLADGPQAFEVRARDAAGNVDPSPARHTWTIDTRPPDTAFTGGPDGSTNDDTPTFDFGAPGESAATFECSLDAAPFTACASPLTLGPLVPGPHVLRVRAVDAAGHVDPSPAERSLTVEAPPSIGDPPPAIRDLTPPAIGRPTLRPKRPRRGSRVRLRLRFTLSEPARVLIVLERRRGRRYVRVFKRAISATAGPVTVDLRRRFGSRRLRAGVAYRLRVAATDAAGNRSRARTLRLRVRPRGQPRS